MDFSRRHASLAVSPKGAPSGELEPASPRRSRSLILTGSCLAVVGALLFGLMHRNLDRRVPVLAVSRSVPTGRVIQGADLKVVHVSAATGLDPVSASQRSRIIGRVAALPLAAGTLLTPAMLSAPTPLKPGQAVVAVPIRAGLIPAIAKPGARVTVVHTGAASAAVGLSAHGQLTWSKEATVLAVSGRADGSGSRVVSLTVADRDAPAIAAAAAANRLTLIVLPAPQGPELEDPDSDQPGSGESSPEEEQAESGSADAVNGEGREP